MDSSQSDGEIGAGIDDEVKTDETGQTERSDKKGLTPNISWLSMV